MPPINKQSPKMDDLVPRSPPLIKSPTNKTIGLDVPAPVAGSVLSQMVDASSMKEQYIKACFYGRNRIGKTTLACQFPKPLLLVAMEPTETGGAMSISRMEGVKVLTISAKQQIDPTTNQPESVWGSRKALTLADELSRGNPFKTVVIDTATAYQDLILTEILGLTAVPEMLTWGMVSEEQYRDRSSKTREALRPFMELKCHVVICAQEKDHSPPQDRSKSKLTRTMQLESFFAADLGGATVKWLHDACGYIGQLYQELETKEVTTPVEAGGKTEYITEEVPTGRIVRRLRTMYHPNFAAGMRSPNPSVVPEYIQADTPEQMYADLMRVIGGTKAIGGKYPKAVVK